MEALYIHIATKLESIRFGPQAGGGSKLFNIDELKSASLWRAVFAEMLAQILFVVLGCCSAMAIGNTTSDAWMIKISLAFGLAIMALIQMVGHVSGGHINPAVTIAMAVAMNISILRCLLYVLAQIAGAIIGGLVAKGLTPSEYHDQTIAVTKLAAGVTPAQGFGMELILTFCLVTVIFGTTDPHRASFGSPAVLIGLTVTLGHLTGIQYTGASMNPSRSLGSAVASEFWTDHWIYWVAPICGGVLSAIIYKFILSPYKGVTSVEEAIERMNGDASLGAPRSHANGDVTHGGVANGGFTNGGVAYINGGVSPGGLSNGGASNGHGGLDKPEAVISTQM